MIYVDENFLSMDECGYFVKLFLENKNKTREYRSTKILSTKLLYDKSLDASLQKITNKVRILFDVDCTLNNSQLVLWPSGSYQNPHYDPPGDLCACIIYLNDNYNGGSTSFNENLKIKPEVGKCLIFSNSQYLHWVEKITEGNRYTLSTWFINKLNN
jgi:hypothetical protein